MTFHIIIEGHDDLPVPIHGKAAYLILVSHEWRINICKNLKLLRQLEDKCIPILIAMSVRQLPFVAQIDGSANLQLAVRVIYRVNHSAIRVR
ncbi:hypothetical protein D1872_290870 [compost metagenome]